MMDLIELDLIDGGAYDCIPHSLALVESFDTLKNEAFPDASAFVLYQSDQGFGHLLTSTTIEEIGEALRLSGPADWFEVKNKSGNRVLVRRSSITARRSLDEGSALTVMVGGGNQTIEVEEDIQQVRTLMKNPTLADAPPGMEPVVVAE